MGYVPILDEVDSHKNYFVGYCHYQNHIKLSPEKIIYVSCNPTTQARDTEILHMNGYRLTKLTMVDMFPHTPHVETVGIFEKQ